MVSDPGTIRDDPNYFSNRIFSPRTDYPDATLGQVDLFGMVHSVVDSRVSMGGFVYSSCCIFIVLLSLVSSS